MRAGEKRAVGIDISQDRICIVELKSGGDGVELLKSAVAALPDGAVKDGNIADPALLSKAIKELKRRSKIQTNRAAVSLFVRPAVVQLMDMPKQVPSNIRQFVNSEIKNCVVLPGRDITVDFCGIGSVRRSAEKRVLAVAAESEKIVELVRTCDKAGFRVEMIQPTLLAYLRAIQEKKISGKTGYNFLAAILQEMTLTLCVLRNGVVDFIRTKEIAKAADVSSGDLNVAVRNRMVEEISQVVKFFDIEVSESTGKWDIMVFADGRESVITEENIKSKIKAENVQVRTIEDAYIDTPVGNSIAEANEKPSPAAVGLALNLLTEQEAGVRANSADLWRINLLPPQINRIRDAKRDALIAVNAIAVVGLILLMTINAFDLLITRATVGALSKKKLIEKQDTSILLEQQKLLDSRLEFLTARLGGIDKIRASHKDVDWVKVLNEIGGAVPGSVRITSILCQDGSQMLIQGLALSNEAVYSFVDLLEKSPAIESVTLLETREHNWRDGLITYQLSCRLGFSGEEGNVS